MKRLLVWDLPVRLFHVLLGLTFIGTFGIVNLVDDQNSLFSAHMLLGLVLAFMVILRLVWGFVGTRHARFSDFLHGPRAVLTYLKDTARGRPTHHAGHNPGSSVAIFLMRCTLSRRPSPALATCFAARNAGSSLACPIWAMIASAALCNSGSVGSSIGCSA